MLVLTVTCFPSGVVIEVTSLSSFRSYLWSCLWPVFKLYEFVILLFISELFYIFRSSGGLKIKILQHVFVNTLWLTWDIGPFVNEQTGNRCLWYPLPKYILPIIWLTSFVIHRAVKKSDIYMWRSGVDSSGTG